MMLCSGAAEQAMSQWSSYFAEAGLKVTKTVGDILGPCTFAAMMGLSRLFFGLKSNRIDLRKGLIVSCTFCVFSYLMACFSRNPFLSLAGCALCGLSVGILWPGTFSLSAAGYPQGGTAMFALLALAGDVGCSAGPGLVGIISASAANTDLSLWTRFLGNGDIVQTSLKIGLLTAIVFPILLAVLAFNSKAAANHIAKNKHTCEHRTLIYFIPHSLYSDHKISFIDQLACQHATHTMLDGCS